MRKLEWLKLGNVLIIFKVITKCLRAVHIEEAHGSNMLNFHLVIPNLFMLGAVEAMLSIFEVAVP